MKRVFFDIDTQIDFMFPAGALYVPGAERIIHVIAELNRHAAATGSPLISTTDAHLENDSEFRDWPAHCVSGTAGQQKPQATLLPNRLTIPAVDSAERIDGYQQLLLEKRHLDCFTNPNLEGILMAFDADRYTVYGVVAEICVKFAAFGLLDRGKQVEIVTDAVRSLNDGETEKMYAGFKSRGGILTHHSAVVT